mmetsp:Transcript_28052/g.42987  ORF Transcript_28052/g.42987 Transcript_28052/m.42987 type:complete len:90 (-) Transcript_28052:1233-1502(-)
MSLTADSNAESQQCGTGQSGGTNGSGATGTGQAKQITQLDPDQDVNASVPPVGGGNTGLNQQDIAPGNQPAVQMPEQANPAQLILWNGS